MASYELVCFINGQASSFPLPFLWCDCSEVLYICPTPSEESCFERPKKDPETGEVELYTSIDGILQAKLKDGWINWSQGD